MAVPILTYHEIVPTPDSNTGFRERWRTPFSVTEPNFDTQMRHLQTAGYTSMLLSDFMACREGRSVLPEKPVVITFDDGLASQYSIAYPILMRYGLTATFFVRVGFLGKPGMLTLEQLRIMHHEGMAIESHTLTHPFLTRVDEDELRWQLEESRRLLQEEIAGSGQFISIPEGIYNEKVVAMVRGAGYAAAATSDVGANRLDCNIYRLRRIGIHRNTDASHFARFAAGHGLLERRFWQVLLVLVKRILGIRVYERLKGFLLGTNAAESMNGPATRPKDGRAPARLLFVPLEVTDPGTNERSPALIRVLARHHKLIGIRRVPYSAGKASLILYLKYLWFAIRVMKYGISHRREFDIIFCEHASYGMGAAPLAMTTGKPLVLDVHGHGQTYGDEVGIPRLQTLFRTGMERAAGRVAKTIITVSEVDRQLFIGDGFHPDKVAVIPTAADFSITERPGLTVAEARRRLGLDAQQKILLFIGKRVYRPNFESAEWINQRLAPAIARRQDTVILLSGSGPVPEGLSNVVKVTGYVPDIYALIMAADLCIAPVWKGVGIMTKVIDTMACSKASVVSRFCTKGIPELVDGENVAIADDGDEFVDKTIHLLEHPEEADRLGGNARQTIEEHYNWDRWRNTLEVILRKCAEGHGNERTS